MTSYKFILSNGLLTHIAIPIWKSDMAKEYAFEQNQMFRRASLSDSLVFLADDYDWIMGQSFETKIFITLQVDWQGNGTFVDYWKGSFSRTDCTVNIDDHSIKVKPNVEDEYNKILAGLEKEYDLVKLNPANQPVQMKRRPLLQVYAKGEQTVSCFLGGMSWEQDTVTTDFSDSQMEDDLHFGTIGEFVQITFGDNPPAGLEDGFSGTIDHGSEDGEWPDLSNDQGVYFMTYFFHRNGVMGKGFCIYSISDPTTVLWEYTQLSEITPLPDTFTMVSQRAGVADLQATMTKNTIFARWLLGEELENSFEIPSGDLVTNNRNYRWCYPFVGDAFVRTTNRSTSTPTQWGIRPDGKYYLPPVLSPDEQYVIDDQFPISRTTWGYSSVWLQWYNGLSATEAQLRTDLTLRDAYTLEDVIKVLLKEIDPSLSFYATSTYSQFLYGTNPLMSGFGRLVLTPKSNVLVAEYTQPAQKAPITLATVLNMLKNALGCYWFIDGSKRLRIEHISYFKNGMSYSGSPQVGVDVTQMYNSRNGHVWTLGTGQYNFDKMQMAERYEYSWMDDTTDAFKGDAIEVLSTFVQEGNIEEITVSRFNADIDYMLLNPTDVSEDGFALMCCEVSGTTFTVPFDTIQYGSKMLTIQNYMLAMIVLQPAFLISNMPAWNLRVNGAAKTAKGIERKKKQQLKVPIGEGDGDLTKLVKTSVGSGEIERMSVSLTSRTATFNLRFDTTEQPL